MTASTRAFFGVALLALPCAALLLGLALLELAATWGAMVHLTLFGWITAMIIGVNYHTLPVFSARDFPSQFLIWLHWAVYTAGLALTTAGLLANQRTIEVVGLALHTAGGLLFTANVMLLFLRGPRHAQRPPMPPIANQQRVDRTGTLATQAAGLALPLALLLLLAARAGAIAGTWVLAAEHLATLGWIMLMIAGVAYHVLPRFTGSGTRGHVSAQTQVLCHLGALLLMVPALGFGWALLFGLGGLLMAAAIALFVWTIWPALQPLRMPPAAIPLTLKERIQ